MDNHTRELMFSSGSDEYETPLWLFRRLDSVFGFTLDPCASDFSHMLSNYFTQKNDGLSANWGTHKPYINPPYSQCKAWLLRASEHYLGTKRDTVVLVPARTETTYWHDYVWDTASYVLFLKGRLKFINRMALSYACIRSMLQQEINGNFSHLYESTVNLYRKNHTKDKEWKNPPDITDAWDAYRKVNHDNQDPDSVIEKLLPPSSAPFPSAVVIYTEKKLTDEFDDLGKLITL